MVTLIIIGMLCISTYIVIAWDMNQRYDRDREFWMWWR